MKKLALILFGALPIFLGTPIAQASNQDLNNHLIEPDSTANDQNWELSQFDRSLTPFQLSQSLENIDLEAIDTIESNTAEIDNENSEDLTNLDQVTSVSQLSDVSPTDWAFQALQSLVERYGCIAGYPDSTYRGNRSLTRYEFAAGLNACLDQINRIIASGVADAVTREDLLTLQKLQEEYAVELASLKGRIDVLEARQTELQANQFTGTTTVLGGRVILGLSGAWGGDPPGEGKSGTVFSHLTQLQTATTFTGKDRLRVDLEMGNFSGRGFADPSALNTFTSLLSFQSDTANKVRLSMVEYRFLTWNDRLALTFRPVGFDLATVLYPNAPLLDNGRGAISRFGGANPIFKIGDLDSGIGLDWLVSNRLRLQLAYGSRNSSSPNQGFLFGQDNWIAGGQILYLLGRSALTGITFIHGSSPDGKLRTFTGSSVADSSGFINQRSNIYALGGSFQWQITPQFNFSTWGGLAGIYAAKTESFAVSSNWAVSLALSDLFGRRGDLLGIIVGQPPKLLEYDSLSISTGLVGGDAFSLHGEMFYRFKVSDNISITPGFFFVTHPGNFEDNNTIYVGTVRTTFQF